MRTRILTLIFGFFFVLFGVVGQAYANTTADKQRLGNGAPWYWPGLNCNLSNTEGGTGGNPTTIGNGSWNTNLQPPYWLEEFVINVLEDIAKTTGVPQTDTVTQEHVVAMVAWAYEEGGNITNTDEFNPWNTGLDDPALVKGGHDPSGVQSFKSFDAGVMANTLVMTGTKPAGKFQTRLAKVLDDPISTADQFMKTLTYYQNYKGNLAWAGADDASKPGEQANYLQGLEQILHQTRANYTQYATVVIGPGEENTHHVDKGKLHYGGGTDNPSTNGDGTTDTGGNGCPLQVNTSTNCTDTNGKPASGRAAIACQALLYDTLSYSMAWHSTGSEFHQHCDAVYKGRKPPQTVDGHAVGPECFTDCSGLVDLVLYDLYGTNIADNTDLMRSDSANFQKIQLKDLQPGDFVQPMTDHVEIIESVRPAKGVTMLYTFAAHTDGWPQPKQVSRAHYPAADGFTYWRYVGKGHATN